MQMTPKIHEYKIGEEYTKAELAELDCLEWRVCTRCGADCVTHFLGQDVWDKLKALNINSSSVPSGVVLSKRTVVCMKCRRVEAAAKEERQKPKAVRRVLRSIKPVFVCPVCANHFNSAIVCFSSKQKLAEHLEKQHDSGQLNEVANEKCVFGVYISRVDRE